MIDRNVHFYNVERIQRKTEVLSIQPPVRDPMELLISDGSLFPQNLQRTGHDQQWLQQTLQHNQVASLREVFLLCANRAGDIIFYRKEQ